MAFRARYAALLGNHQCVDIILHININVLLNKLSVQQENIVKNQASASLSKTPRSEKKKNKLSESETGGQNNFIPIITKRRHKISMLHGYNE